MPTLPTWPTLVVRCCVGLCVAGWVHAAIAAQEVEASDVVTLHYQERVPYEYQDNGQVQGLWATPAEQAFRKADIPFKWAATPITRQLHLMQSNRGLHCAAGRFWTADRAQWARFSKPIYRNRPMGLIARSDNAALRGYSHMEHAIKTPTVRLLVKKGYSYGPKIDGYIAQRRQPTSSTHDESLHMLRQIHRGMADTFPISEDEFEGLLARTSLPAHDFVLLKFPDAPKSELRYIMCSMKVPPHTMERLNAAIEFKER